MRWTATGITSVCLLLAGVAFSKPGFENHIPNSNAKGLWGTTCQLCHLSAGGGGALSVFGQDVKKYLTPEGFPNWEIISQLDSDGDSYSNGHELGDLDGMWKPGGSVSPFGTVTNPSDPESFSTEPLAIQRIQVPTTWAVIKALFQ
jgi:hypothetical protein